ncbi:unnamed protein product [Ascophyllum nodosum]
MDRLFRPSRPRALSLTGPPWCNLRHRVIFCTSRRSASSRTGGDATAHIIIETPGSDSLAR